MHKQKTLEGRFEKFLGERLAKKCADICREEITSALEATQLEEINPYKEREKLKDTGFSVGRRSWNEAVRTQKSKHKEYLKNL